MHPFLDFPERWPLPTKSFSSNQGSSWNILGVKNIVQTALAFFYFIINSLDANWTALECELRFRTP